MAALVADNDNSLWKAQFGLSRYRQVSPHAIAGSPVRYTSTGHGTEASGRMSICSFCSCFLPFSDHSSVFFRIPLSCPFHPPERRHSAKLVIGTHVTLHSTLHRRRQRHRHRQHTCPPQMGPLILIRAWEPTVPNKRRWASWPILLSARDANGRKQNVNMRVRQCRAARRHGLFSRDRRAHGEGTDGVVPIHDEVPGGWLETSLMEERRSECATHSTPQHAQHTTPRHHTQTAPSATRLVQGNMDEVFLHGASNSPINDWAKAHALWHSG